MILIINYFVLYVLVYLLLDKANNKWNDLSTPWKSTPGLTLEIVLRTLQFIQQ